MWERKERGSGKIKIKYKAKQLYKYYLANTEEKLALDNGTFYKVVMDLNNGLLKQVLDSKTVRLAAGLGYLSIRKRKMTSPTPKDKRRIDMKTSMLLKKKIYFTTDINKGYFFRWLWQKHRTVANVSVYSFLPVKPARSELGIRLRDKITLDYMMIQ